MAGIDAPRWFRSIKIATSKIVLLIASGTRGERGVRVQGHVVAAIEYDFEVLCLIPSWMEAHNVLKVGRRRPVFATPSLALLIAPLDLGVFGQAAQRHVAEATSVETGSR